MYIFIIQDTGHIPGFITKKSTLYLYLLPLYNFNFIFESKILPFYNFSSIFWR